ncbi:sterol desaturase family protein [Myxococcota bacterium]|nr:sterol desaturase family protein [Myxococcota bacterium]
MPDWIVSFIAASLGQAFSFLAVVSLVFVVIWRWGAKRLEGRRIRTKGRPFDGAQLRHELVNTGAVLLVGTAQGALISALYDRGLTTLTMDLGALGWGGALALTVGLVLFNDLWFYAVHRTLHTPWLFKHVHSVHHRSVDVNPFTSYSFHVVEGALLGAWVIPALLFVPMPMPVLMAAHVIGTTNNLMAHLGYELLPAWWTRAPLLRWSNTATFHSLHHGQLKGNYGLFTRTWDRLLGTELPSYEQAFAAATASGAPRPATDA